MVGALGAYALYCIKTHCMCTVPTDLSLLLSPHLRRKSSPATGHPTFACTWLMCGVPFPGSNLKPAYKYRWQAWNTFEDMGRGLCPGAHLPYACVHHGHMATDSGICLRILGTFFHPLDLDRTNLEWVWVWRESVVWVRAATLQCWVNGPDLIEQQLV